MIAKLLSHRREIHLPGITGLQLGHDPPDILQFRRTKFGNHQVDRLLAGLFVHLRRQEPADHVDFVRFTFRKFELAGFLVAATAFQALLRHGREHRHQLFISDAMPAALFTDLLVTLDQGSLNQSDNCDGPLVALFDRGFQRSGQFVAQHVFTH